MPKINVGCKNGPGKIPNCTTNKETTLLSFTDHSQLQLSLNSENSLPASSDIWGNKNVGKTKLPEIQNGGSEIQYGGTTISGKIDEQQTIRVYSKRFWILFIFSAISFLNSLQQFEYVSLTNIYTCYYGVSDFEVNWTLLVYMIAYIALVFPSIWFLDRFGLRTTVLFGAFLGCLSMIIQCRSLHSNGFPLVMASQTVSAIAQPFILPIPPKLASVWFGPTEICRATAIGVIGNQLGSAIGFILGPMLLPDNCTESELIYKGQRIETYSLTVANVLVFVLLISTFQEKPPCPPNFAEATKMPQKCNYGKSLKALMSNVNFVLLFVCYGFSSGIFFAVSTVLNEMLVSLYPGSEEAIGLMGLILIIAGIVGSIIAGVILDSTHKFKEVSLAIFISSFLSMCLFTGTLYIPRMWVQFITITILGFFLTSYLPVGFELAAELTYPENEGTTAGLLNASLMGFSMIFSIIGSALLDNYGSLACNMFFCAVLLVASVIMGFIKCECKRSAQNAKKD